MKYLVSNSPCCWMPACLWLLSCIQVFGTKQGQGADCPNCCLWKGVGTATQVLLELIATARSHDLECM